MPRVLELAPLFAGPLVGQLLLQGGCSVLKVEPPAGDPARRLPPLVDGVGFLYGRLNAGKETVLLDLKSPHGREVLQRHLGSADVVVDGNRPGVLETWTDPHALARAGKVVLRLSGYGQATPQARELGHDLTYAAHAGLLELQGAPLAVPVADVAGALWGVAQVWRRLALGGGAVLDVSLTGGARLVGALPRWMAAASARGGNDLHGAVPWYGLYECRDGSVAMAALEPELWPKAAAALGLEIRSDAKAIAGAVRGMTCKDVLAKLQQAGVGAAPIASSGSKTWGADDPWPSA